MTNEYETFLESKRINTISSGFDIETVNPLMFDFQRDITKWSLKKGKSAVFAGTGLGKTIMQLEWAKHIHEHEDKPVLILAPLAVSMQTVEEGKKFNIDVNLCRSQDDVVNGINITNYEMLHHFDINNFIGIVLDESSILKSFTGKVRTEIIDQFQYTPYKLACTATPSPNDYMELGNHAEFLNVMSRTEMLSTFFVHDGGETSKWRLKKHAVKEFWIWVSSWAVMLRNPIDLGYTDADFNLPELRIHEIIVDKTGYRIKEAQTLNERRDARRNSINDRVSCAAEIANSNDDCCLVWCDLNNESELLTKAINNAVEIKGAHTPEYKSENMIGFSNGNVNCLVTKPSIAGFGMNWQHCNKMIFVGLSDSFELYYQAVRRCWRFGQKHPVDVYIITSEKEGAVVKNIKRKEKDFEEMLKGMIATTQELTTENIKETAHTQTEYLTDDVCGENWRVMLGDNIESIKECTDNSVHFICYSPPFSSLYTYSNSLKDMGNCRNDEEFFNHFAFLSKELYRTLMPGRLMSVHCMNLPAMKSKDGYIGVKDFRGDLIKLFQDIGFIYHSEVCIWKDPVISMQRTKALGLLHKQIKKDSAMCRQGIPDYLVTFRKPGDNPERVTHTNESFPVGVWQNYASPVWMDINPSDTLQKASAREYEDERHIAPLQLQVIERAIDLWTNPSDLILDPFSGIGSTGYVAVKKGRQYLGFELKKSYFDQSIKNMAAAVYESKKPKQSGLDCFGNGE
jgi:DNA modification methylase